MQSGYEGQKKGKKEGKGKLEDIWRAIAQTRRRMSGILDHDMLEYWQTKKATFRFFYNTLFERTHTQWQKQNTRRQGQDFRLTLFFPYRAFDNKFTAHLVDKYEFDNEMVGRALISEYLATNKPGIWYTDLRNMAGKPGLSSYFLCQLVATSTCYCCIKFQPARGN